MFQLLFMWGGGVIKMKYAILAFVWVPTAKAELEKKAFL